MIKLIMRFLVVLGCLFALNIESQLNAQANDNQPNTLKTENATALAQHYLGINILHPAIVGVVSLSMAEDVFYLPMHLSYAHAFSGNLGISALVIYRYEKDADFRTNEFGFAVGPRLSFNRLQGFYVDCKFGIGYAFGVNYSNHTYSRLDFVIEPDIGFNFVISKNFSITLGIGTQTLLLLNETPSRVGHWDWNEIGTLSHYFLPVLNLSAALMF